MTEPLDQTVTVPITWSDCDERIDIQKNEQGGGTVFVVGAVAHANLAFRQSDGTELIVKKGQSWKAKIVGKLTVEIDEEQS